MKVFALAAAFALLCAPVFATPAIAAPTTSPPEQPAPKRHQLPATDDDLAVLNVAVRDIGKLCQLNDDDCLAQIKLRQLATRWEAALQSEARADSAPAAQAAAIKTAP